MKIALIADTHWGIRGDNLSFHDYFKKSLDEFFFPYLRENGIERIIHLGDVVDRRKQLNYMTAHRLRKDFLEPIEKEFRMDIIVGNHDTYFKNTNDLNALTEIVSGKYKNIDIFTRSQTVMHDDFPILYVPWMCEDNIEHTIKAINETSAQVCLGHLELAGFEMYKGHLSDHGFNHKIFEKFDFVGSGHYHHKSTVGNISYLGAFAEFIWTDCDDPRGFHVYDTDTRRLDFIQNPFTMFKKIQYDDFEKSMEEVVKVPDDITNKFLKIIVKNKTNPYWFDLFIDKIEEKAPNDLQVIEDQLSMELENAEDLVDEAQDTITIFKNYIEQLNLSNNKKDKLQKAIVGLYQEAMTIE